MGLRRAGFKGLGRSWTTVVSAPHCHPPRKETHEGHGTSVLVSRSSLTRVVPLYLLTDGSMQGMALSAGQTHKVLASYSLERQENPTTHCSYNRTQTVTEPNHRNYNHIVTGDRPLNTIVQSQEEPANDYSCRRAQTQAKNWWPQARPPPCQGPAPTQMDPCRPPSGPTCLPRKENTFQMPQWINEIMQTFRTCY